MRISTLLSASVLCLLTSSAAAQIVVNESFTGATTSSPEWRYSGDYTPRLTASRSNAIDQSGSGWLRLTDNQENRATAAYLNESFSSDRASIYASFDYVSWGGTGADGIVFFLFDSKATFRVGADGGSIGYAQKAGVNGMNGGYLGIAIDEYGNFSDASEGRNGGIGRQIDSVSVRGPGQGQTGYSYIGGTTSLTHTTGSIDRPGGNSRPEASHVEIFLSVTNQLMVTLTQPAGANQTVLSLDLSGFERPEDLKMGFASGSGGNTNIHEIRNVKLTAIAAREWDGGGANSQWGTSNNWDPNSVPADGADILLGRKPATAQTIDVQGNRIVRSVTIDSGRAYTLNNGTLTFDALNTPGFIGLDVSGTNGSANHTINSSLALRDDIYVRQNSTGTLTVNGNVAAGSNDITFGGSGLTTVTGQIAGSGAVIKEGTGTTVFSGNNNFSGNVAIKAGTLQVRNNTALGSTSGVTTISSGATLESGADVRTSESIFVSGSGVNGAGAIRATNNSDFWVDGTTTLTGATTLSATSGSLLAMSGITGNHALTFSGDGWAGSQGNINIGGAGVTVAMANDGMAGFAGNVSNTYTGTTTVNSGTLVLMKGGNTTAVAGALVVGDGSGVDTVLLGAHEQIANGSSVTLKSSGVLNLAGHTETVRSLSSTGGKLDLGTSGKLTLTDNSSFSGSILGSGTLALDGAGSGQRVATLSLLSGLNNSALTLDLDGILNLNANTHSLGTLNLRGNSTIDFAAGGSILNLTNLNLNGYTLTITNWTDSVDYFYAQNFNGAVFDKRDQDPMDRITFSGFVSDRTVWQSYDRQITPVPEPSTYGLILGALSLGGVWLYRRRTDKPKDE